MSEQGNIPDVGMSPHEIQQLLAMHTKLMEYMMKKNSSKDRDLAALPALTGEMNLDNWIQAVKFMAMRADVEDYINKTIPAPAKESPEYGEWKGIQGDLINWMMSSIKNDTIRSRLHNIGWVATDLNAHDLFMKIQQVLRQGTAEMRVILMRDYFQIRRDKFTSFMEFISKLQLYKSRLEALDYKFDDKIHITNALGAIRGTYKDLYDFLFREQEAGRLTWNTLQAEFTSKAVTEENAPALAAITVQGGKKKRDGESSSTTNNTDRSCKTVQSTMPR